MCIQHLLEVHDSEIIKLLKKKSINFNDFGDKSNYLSYRSFINFILYKNKFLQQKYSLLFFFFYKNYL